MKHGQSQRGKHTKEYMAWKSMIRRCENPTLKDIDVYQNVKICQAWREDFRNFYIDMGPAPTSNYSLDRIDSHGDYEPSNCRWATAKEQAVNRKTTIMIGGVCLKDHCDLTGLNYQTVTTRLGRGWSLDDALNRPVRRILT